MDARMKRGFTMLEILLVVLILAALAGILFPAFSAARKEARMSRCAANLRQIGMAAGMYAQDYGAYPEPVRLVQSLRGKGVLSCPEDDHFTRAASSYTFRSILPPDFQPYWLVPELDPDTVLAVCGKHQEQPKSERGNSRTVGAARFPYKLALRASGSVERIHLSRIREMMVPGDRPMFARVYPGEAGYEQARRP
jgi:prepilin-type N-terminal cleavage/methylation domain-containing protein